MTKSNNLNIWGDHTVCSLLLFYFRGPHFSFLIFVWFVKLLGKTENKYNPRFLHHPFFPIFSCLPRPYRLSISTYLFFSHLHPFFSHFFLLNILSPLSQYPMASVPFCFAFPLFVLCFLRQALLSKEVIFLV